MFRAGLHNDLRGTMDELHRVLNSIHTAIRNSTPAESPPRFLQSPPSPSAAARMEQPFAAVQNVEPNSPACDGGMKVGDKVIRFGDAQGPAGLTVLQSRLSVRFLHHACLAVSVCCLACAVLAAIMMVHRYSLIQLCNHRAGHEMCRCCHVVLCFI
jgi:hypothetical protein